MRATLAPTQHVRAAAGMAALAMLVAGLTLPGRAAHAVEGAARPTTAVRTAGAVRAATLPASTACSGAGPVTCELWAKPGTLALAGVAGGTVPIWGLSDTADGAASTPGPVLVVTTGQAVTLTVHNGLSDNLAMSVPGVRTTGTGTGDDITGVTPGNAATYTFTAPAPGTYLYEAGHTDLGARQVAMGLAGALVVRPAGFDSTAPTLDGTAATAFADEAVLVLSEVDPAFNNAPKTFNLKQFRPTHRLINGLEYPSTSAIPTAHGNRVLLRYVNAGLVGHSMGVLGAKEQVLALGGHADGDRPMLVSDMVPAGQTEDALVTFPAGGADRLPVYETAGTLDNAGQVVGTSRIVGFGGMLTFLQSDAVTTPGDTAGPTVSNVAVTPAPVLATSPATVTASASDANTGGGNIARVEYVIDSQNVALGSGTAMTATDGALDSPTEPVVATVSTTTLAGLSQGTHVMYVRALDSNGKWGAASSASFKVGTTGPTTSGLSLTPNPVNTGSVALSATGDDSSLGGRVTAGEYFIDTLGTNASGTPLTIAAPGTVVSGSATISAVSIAGLVAGSHTVYVHFMDDSNLWGPTATISLKVDRTGPALGTSGNSVTPSVTDGTTGTQTDPTSLKVHATFVDDASNVVAAEGFLDNPAGTSGSGIVFLADDGSWSSLSEAGYGLVPLSQLTGLPAGTHTVYVHAKDAAGNWGPLAPLSFVIDRGPVVTAGTFSSSVSVLAGTQILATATGMGTITSAEMFQGTDPGPGNASSMVVTATGPTSAQLKADPRSIGVGTDLLVWVRAKDVNGIWGKAVPVAITVTGIFGDGFESGTTGAWSSVTNATRLAVLKAAAMDGTWGLRATALTNNTAYVRRNFTSTSTLHVRFKLDPQTLTTPSANAFVTVLQALATNSQVFAVQLRNGPSGREVRLVVGTVNGPWTALSTGVSEIQVDRTTGANGTRPTTLRVNGSLIGTALTNGTASANNVRFGIAAASGSGNNTATRTTGFIYLDSFGATN